MRGTRELPLPSLLKGFYSPVTAYTDEALFDQRGIRLAFTERSGGASTGPYCSLNMSTGVDDDPATVIANRKLLLSAFGITDAACLIPRQVHGDTVLALSDDTEEQIAQSQELAERGADAVLVEVSGVAALLCFADCIPVIAVSPSGRFAVVHAGWRGVENGIVVKALSMMLAADAADGLPTEASQCNLYIGPHIHACCFEAGADVADRFIRAFGDSCVVGTNIDLNLALRAALARAGAEEARIADVGACTVCENDRFFSYRAQDGVCGRHGAFALKI